MNETTYITTTTTGDARELIVSIGLLALFLISCRFIYRIKGRARIFMCVSLAIATVSLTPVAYVAGVTLMTAAIAVIIIIALETSPRFAALVAVGPEESWNEPAPKDSTL